MLISCICGMDRYTVTQHKLAFFLQTYVLKKRRSRKAVERTRQDRSAEGEVMVGGSLDALPSSPAVDSPAPEIMGNDASTTDTSTYTAADSAPHISAADLTAIVNGEALGLSSIKVYIAALVDLWSQQHLSGANDHPHPRAGRVTALLRTLEQAQSHSPRRSKATLLAGIAHLPDVVKLANDGLERNSAEGVRDRLMVLLSQSALVRGEDARRLELADLHSLHLTSDREGEQCVAVMVTLRNGRTNADGKAEMAGVLRHKDVEACSVGALALHLFCRFHLGTYPKIDEAKQEQFPDFTNRTWYDLKLFPSSTPTTAIQYGTHYKSFRTACARQGVDPVKVKHLMRATSAAGMAEIDADMPGEQSALATRLRSQLPRQTMRSLAGYTPECSGEGSIARDVPVPEELLNAVFPLASSRLKELENEEDGNLAAVGFLTLLTELRSVIIQDAVLLRQRYPQHVVFDHPIFQSNTFNRFAETMLASMAPAPTPMLADMAAPSTPLARMAVPSTPLASMAAPSTPMQEVLRRLEPHLIKIFTAGMSSLEQTIRQSFDETAASFAQLEAKIVKESMATRRLMQDIVSSFNTIAARQSTGIRQLTAPAAPAPADSDYVTPDRSVRTVKQLWKEYDAGICGRPALKTVYGRAGFRWTVENDRKHFQRRQVILNEIKRRAEVDGVGARDVAAQLDAYMFDTRVKSLNKLQDVIRSGSLPAVLPETGAGDVERDVQQMLQS